MTVRNGAAFTKGLQAGVDPENGVIYPDLFALQAGRALGPVYYPEMLAMIKRWPAAGSSSRGAGISARDKTALFMLAWDLCGSEFGARHERYEMNYAGERGGILAGIQREYGRKAHYLDHLDRFIRGWIERVQLWRKIYGT